jgi:hypothetical protein
MNTIFGAVMGPLATYFFSILGLFIVAGYAIFRLNSTQIIREKIWSSFVGDKDFNDEKLKSFAHDQLDLTHFRVVYGVPARSVMDIHRLLSWMEQYKVSPVDVKRIRGWIHPSRDEPLKIPSKRYILVWIAVFGILMLSTTLPVTASDFKATLLKMNVSGTWFTSDGTSVNAVWGGWRIDSQSCTKHTLPDIKVTGLTGAETTAICNGIADGELKTMVSDPLKYQRRVFAVIVLVILLLSLGAYLNMNVAMLARQLGNRLRSEEKASSEQPQLLEEVSPVDL